MTPSRHATLPTPVATRGPAVRSACMSSPPRGPCRGRCRPRSRLRSQERRAARAELRVRGARGGTRACRCPSGPARRVERDRPRRRRRRSAEPRRSSSAVMNRWSTRGVSPMTSDLGGKDAGRDEVDVTPRVGGRDACLQHRLDESVALGRSHAGMEPAEHAAEPDETDAVAPFQVARRERGRRSDGVLESAASVPAHVPEAVDEEHDVCVAFGVALVDDEPLPASGGAPVDRANTIARDEVANVGVLHAFPLYPRDLASGECLRLERCEDGMQRDRARVRLQSVRMVDAALPCDETKCVARADVDAAEVEDSPARTAQSELEVSRLVCRGDAWRALSCRRRSPFPAEARPEARADRWRDPHGCRSWPRLQRPRWCGRLPE